MSNWPTSMFGSVFTVGKKILQTSWYYKAELKGSEAYSITSKAKAGKTQMSGAANMAQMA